MSAAVCGAQHPTEPLSCDKAVPCVGYHACADPRTVWGVVELPEPSRPAGRRRARGPGKADIAMIASRAT